VLTAAEGGYRGGGGRRSRTEVARDGGVSFNADGKTTGYRKERTNCLGWLGTHPTDGTGD
jgi:hypothetical protein